MAKRNDGKIKHPDHDMLLREMKEQIRKQMTEAGHTEEEIAEALGEKPKKASTPDEGADQSATCENPNSKSSQNSAPQPIPLDTPPRTTE